ncbi:MAG TPA: hypothetical protein VH702_19095 [Vicinamibacterales bacterium]|jgi:hypothetical protein
MPRVPFEELPPDARLWIFPAGRRLSLEEKQVVLAETDAFIAQWSAHGVPLRGAREVRHDQFVLVGVDERAAGVSGCSIDALVRRMQHVEVALGVELTNNAPVLYRDGDVIARVAREDFGALVAAGRVGLDTMVFDNTLTTVGDIRDGRWEIQAAQSWHARAFW